MSIKSPETYGEWWVRTHVEGQEYFDEELEKLYAGFFGGFLSEIPAISQLPAGMQNFINALSNPPHAGMGGFALGVGVEMVDTTLAAALDPILKMLTRTINRSSRETWLTSSQANLLFSRKKITEELWESIVASEGYADVLGGFLYKSQLPYPSINDLIIYSRYHGDPENVWSTLQDFYNIEAEDFRLFEWLSLQRLTTEQVQTLYKRKMLSVDNVMHEFAQLGWDKTDQVYLEELSWQVPNAMLLVQGGLMQDLPIDQLLLDIQSADIHPEYGNKYIDAVLTKAATQDIINYQLRVDPNLTNLDTELRRIGIHPNYLSMYKELAYQIPPVGDIITMAVREAFSPDIAAQFGQYQDFPPDFAEWAGKKGLSEFWAKCYWASHWSLPSVTQGFEMLHRGVINESELHLLLRALDVMPFWRDKLIQISYNPLTRVDVRRMYSVGVLNEGEVKQAYLDIGYSEQNAQRLTEYVIKQTLQTQSNFRSSDVIKAYVDRKINRSEARSILSKLGVRDSDITTIIENADYDREWKLIDTKLKAIRNLYRKKVYDEDETRRQLTLLDLPPEQVDLLMQQWYYEIEAEDDKLWTVAQTLTFLKSKLITPDRARDELKALRYSKERIEVLIQSTNV